MVFMIAVRMAVITKVGSFLGFFITPKCKCIKIDVSFKCIN